MHKEAAEIIRKRHNLCIEQESLYKQRMELDKRIGAVSRQIRRLSDEETARQLNTTPTQVRRAAYQ